MKSRSTTDTGTLASLLIFGGLCLILTLHGAFGLPNGASILSNSSDTATATSPPSRADARGTITVLTLSGINQNQNWKGYVGNVSGRLSLDNADGFTLYDWTLTGSVAGELYVSRNESPDFTNVSCATRSNLSSEHPIYSMTDGQIDNINNTFNYTVHSGFFVGTISITADSCPSTATYYNGSNSTQDLDGSHHYQEVAIQDVNGSIVYVTLLDNDELGYNAQTYDFQLIVPESDNTTATTYYFWTELSGG